MYSVIAFALVSGFIGSRYSGSTMFESSIVAFKLIGTFSMLWGLQLLSIEKFLKRVMVHLKAAKFCVKRLYRKVTGYYSGETLTKRICDSLFTVIALLLNYIAVMLPIAAPVALLLRLRQVSFVSTLYFHDWTTTELFEFFGFVNNVIGITITFPAEIERIQCMIFGQRDWQPVGEVHNAIERILLSRLKWFEAVIVFNSWCSDPDIFQELWRSPAPCSVDGAKETMSSMENIPVPSGWKKKYIAKVYYIDTQNEKTQWEHPLEKVIKEKANAFSDNV